MFLYDRALDDCIERLRDIARPFEKALLIGCPSPEWPERLRHIARNVDVADPGSRFAQAANGEQIEEDRFDFGEERYDLCIAIGTLDSVNDLPLLERATEPVATNPSPALEAIARERGWRILNLFE